MSQDSFLPPAPKHGWIWIIIVFVVLGATGVTLSLLFRDYTTPEEIRVRERRKNAEKVCFTVVLSTVDSVRARAVIDEIIADIGPDSSITDLVIGSTAEDPWSGSISDYRSSLQRAMSNSRDLPIGKQTLLMSMVAGLLTKMDIPARIYLVGTLNDTLTPGVIRRTMETADAFAIRNDIMGPIEVISYLDTTKPVNGQYIELLRGRPYAVKIR